MEDAVMHQAGTEGVPTALLLETGDEQKLADEIRQLWAVHVDAKTTVKKTKADLKAIRERLSERLYELKQLLARPSRNGQWSAWLKERKISRATADRLVQRYGANLPGNESPHEANSNPSEDTAEKLARVVWSRFRKVLVSDEVVIDFINRFAELAGVGHERRAEGLLIFKSVLKAADELPGSVPAIDLIPRSPDEAPAVTEVPKDETAATPTEVGQAAVADAGSGAVL